MTGKRVEDGQDDGTRASGMKSGPALSFAVLLAVSCAEHAPSGPRPAQRASLAVQPRFPSVPTGGPFILFSRVRGVLHGAGGDSVVSEARFQRDTAVLAFDVQFTGSSATFDLDVTVFDAQGVIVYHAHQVIRVEPGDANVPTP